MPLPDPHAAALRRLSRDLVAAGVPHGLGGSGLLALLGLPVTVRDLDIEVAPGHRSTILGLPALQGFSIHDPYADRGPLLRTTRGEVGGSWMACGRVGDVPVEIFEHYGVRGGAGWEPLPFAAAESVRLGGDEVPLADRAFWWALYTAVDPDKAALLAPLVPPADRARAARDLGVPE